MDSEVGYGLAPRPGEKGKVLVYVTLPYDRARATTGNGTVKALARVFRWRKLLETRVYATIDERAAAEEINGLYVCRVLRLTLLAPDFVEAISDGRQPRPAGRPMKPEFYGATWSKVGYRLK